MDNIVKTTSATQSSQDQQNQSNLPVLDQKLLADLGSYSANITPLKDAYKESMRRISMDSQYSEISNRETSTPTGGDHEDHPTGHQATATAGFGTPRNLESNQKLEGGKKNISLKKKYLKEKFYVLPGRTAAEQQQQELTSNIPTNATSGERMTQQQMQEATDNSFMSLLNKDQLQNLQLQHPYVTQNNQMLSDSESSASMSSSIQLDQSMTSLNALGIGGIGGLGHNTHQVNNLIVDEFENSDNQIHQLSMTQSLRGMNLETNPLLSGNQKRILFAHKPTHSNLAFDIAHSETDQPVRSTFTQHGHLRHRTSHNNKRKNSKQHREEQLQALHRKLYHPFAERLTSPWDEWKQTIGLAAETFLQFIVLDVMLNGVFFYLFKAFEYTLLSPVALIALIGELIRSLIVKCKKRRAEHNQSSGHGMPLQQKKDFQQNQQLEKKQSLHNDHLSDTQSILSSDELLLGKLIPKKEYIVLIKLVGGLVHITSSNNNETTSKSMLAGSESGLNSSRGSIHGSERPLSQRSTARRIFKRHNIEVFLKYLKSINCKVWVYETVGEGSPLTTEEALSVVKYLEKISGLHIYSNFIIDPSKPNSLSFKSTDKLVKKVVDLLMTKTDDMDEVLSPRTRKYLMKKLVIIDKDPQTLQLYPKNTLQATGLMSKPKTWIEIFDQLKVSKGEDVRSSMPAIIQMLNYYPE